MGRSIGARLLAANQRPGSVATFVVTNAPDVRITARSAGLHGDAALLGERVATVALFGRGAIALRLLGAAAAAGLTGSTRALLAIADAGAGRRRCVEEARPSLGRRRRTLTARAPRRGQPRCQRCLRPSSVGELRECHVCTDTREHGRNWVRLTESDCAVAKTVVPRPNGRQAQTRPRAASRAQTRRAGCQRAAARTCVPSPGP
jgi:hypothetical protein